MFTKARVKLTLWYLLIIMLVSLSFSVFIYRMIDVELDRFARVQRYRIEHRMNGDQLIIPLPNPPNIPSIPLYDQDLVEEARQRVLVSLGFVNAAIFFLSGIFGYLLSGRTLRPIRQMVDEQNRFISDSSHELRTPLASLKTSMEVSLRDKNMTLAEAKSLTSENIEEVNRLQTLVDELLTFTKYGQNNQFQILEPIDIDTVIQKAIESVKLLAKNKKISLIYESQKNIAVQGDSQRLIQLVVLLLDNALKYSLESSEISIKTWQNDNHVFVAVQDYGIGIDKKDIDHIFDRFYRADNARTKQNTGGYGIGLSIAKSIVTQHNGNISVKSTLGKGSTFTVAFPTV